MKNINDHIALALNLGGSGVGKIRNRGPGLKDSLEVMKGLRERTDSKTKQDVPMKLGHTPIPN